jgi:hypothetical protein
MNEAAIPIPRGRYTFVFFGQDVEADNLVEATKLANALAGKYGKPGQTYRVTVFVAGGEPTEITAENTNRPDHRRRELSSVVR